MRFFGKVLLEKHWTEVEAVDCAFESISIRRGYECKVIVLAGVRPYKHCKKTLAGSSLQNLMIVTCPAISPLEQTG